MGSGTSKQNQTQEFKKSKGQQSNNTDVNIVQEIDDKVDENLNDSKDNLSKGSRGKKIINQNKQSQFQPNKMAKPEKGFRIRDSRNSIFNADEDEALSVNKPPSEVQSMPQGRTRRIYKQKQNDINFNNETHLSMQSEVQEINLIRNKRTKNSIYENGQSNRSSIHQNNNISIDNNNSSIVMQRRQRNSKEDYSPVKMQRHLMQQDDNSPLLPKSKQGLVGLKNIGNTCFMNASLQCMFNLPQFNTLFLGNQYKSQLKSKNKGLAKSYAELIQKIRKTGNSGPENTQNLKKSIEQYSQQFQGFSQQDAHELMVTLLDGLHEELNRGKKPKYKELEADIKKKTLQEISDEWYQYYKIQDDSHIQDYFCGQLISTVTCIKCGNESIACDNFHDLSLSFSRAIRMVEDPQIERLFQWYLQEENLDDEFYCSKCKKHRKSTRKFNIWKLPNVLVIHLKRFHFGRTKREKINHKIKFPIKNLDLSRYVNDSTDPTTEDCLYDLIGMVNHVGNLYGGHYIAECRNPIDHRWYQFNDNNVSEIDIKQEEYETTGSSAPYILFYTKKKLLRNLNNPYN